jgi:hypothetical protein
LAYNESRRQDLGTGTCRNCGAEFAKINRTQAYCPRPATCKHDYEVAQQRVNTVKQCRQCGQDFTVDITHKVYCEECKDTVDPVLEARVKQERELKKKEATAALLDERNRTNVVKELLAANERVSGWRPKRFTSTVKKKFSEQHANIVLSDWHTGEKITNEESGHLAEYNLAVQQKRLETCVKSMGEIVGIYRSGGIPIKHMNAHVLGDINTQEKIYKGQHAYIDAYTADQVVISKNTMAEFLLNCLDFMDTIDVYAVPGNHGRMGEKGEGPTWNNFDYLTYLWTRDLLKDYPQIRWFIPRSWFYTVTILGWRFCGSHGDDIISHNRIPYYGIERDINDMRAMLWNIEQHPPNYHLFAHFHMFENAELVHGERIMNGSVVGGSMLSTKGLKRVSRPTQTFFGLSADVGITWRYPLWLEKPKKKDKRKAA